MITKLWKKLVNRETISYLVFGVLTTLVDWVSYWYMRRVGDRLPGCYGRLMGSSGPVCFCDEQAVCIWQL